MQSFIAPSKTNARARARADLARVSDTRTRVLGQSWSNYTMQVHIFVCMDGWHLIGMNLERLKRLALRGYACTHVECTTKCRTCARALLIYVLVTLPACGIWWWMFVVCNLLNKCGPDEICIVQIYCCLCVRLEYSRVQTIIMRISNLLRIRTTVYEKGQARLVPTTTMATAACKFRHAMPKYINAQNIHTYFYRNVYFTLYIHTLSRNDLAVFKWWLCSSQSWWWSFHFDYVVGGCSRSGCGWGG